MPNPTQAAAATAILEFLERWPIPAWQGPNRRSFTECIKELRRRGWRIPAHATPAQIFGDDPRLRIEEDRRPANGAVRISAAAQ